MQPEDVAWLCLFCCQLQPGVSCKSVAYTNKETMEIISSSSIYNSIYHHYSCYLKRQNTKMLKFYLSNVSYFEISPSLF